MKWLIGNRYRQRLLAILLLIGPAVLLSLALATTASAAPMLVVVIDDIGDNHPKGLAAVNLPGRLTYAFLPHTPFAPELARKAHTAGKEVILHAPMENKAGLRLGPGALTQQQSAGQLQQVLNSNFDAIPYAVGLNNHMGSLLTEDQEKMREVMAIARQRGMFFLDSMTSSDTVAWKEARSMGVPYLIRDVFLDNHQERDYINQQFKKALKLAVTRGYAVAIGHPYKETVAYLEEALPIVQGLGVQLVTVSDLLQYRADLAMHTQTPIEALTQTPPQVPVLEHSCDSTEGHDCYVPASTVSSPKVAAPKASAAKP